MKKSVKAGLLCMLVILSAFTCANAAPVQWATGVGGNDHWYEVITITVGDSISWDNAKTAATAAGGYLVTITTAEENLFLTNDPSLGGGESNDLLHSHWMGGYQTEGSTDPAEGWTWVTDEEFTYENWAESEPNDFNDINNENKLVFDHGFSDDGKMWNDIYSNANDGLVPGYVVEYDSAPVPVPATILLLGAGLSGLGIIKRRRRK